MILNIWQTVLNKPPDAHHEDRPVDPRDPYYLADDKQKAAIINKGCLRPTFGIGTLTDLRQWLNNSTVFQFLPLT